MKKKINGLLKSRTFWFNAITWLLTFVNALQSEQVIPTETATTIVAIGNVILRMVTSKKLEDK